MASLHLPGVASCLVLAVLAGKAAPACGETFHVSPHGDDGGPGTAAAPFRTVQRGAEAAQPGDTVLVAPGVYRERVAPPRGGTDGKPIVFRSAERHKAVIKGSDEWRPEWRRHSDAIWSAPVDPAMFTDTAHVDGGNPFEIPLASTPWGREGRPEHERHVRKERGGNPQADKDLVYTLGQVFIDGRQVRQAPLLAEMKEQPDTWWYDPATRELFVHRRAGGPQRCVVEITTRRRIFAAHVRGLGHVEVDGFVFEHCGNQYPTDFWMTEKPHCQQAGAVGTRSGHHWHIHDNIIRLANGVGLDLGLEGGPGADLETGGRKRPGSAGHHVVEGNWILDNGAAGTASYLGTHLVVRRNVVMGNNSLRFKGAKRWESGGIKLHCPRESLIEGNLVAHNHEQWGIWLDQGPGENTRVLRNVVVGHGVGIDFEVGGPVPGRQALVAGNVLVDNDSGITFRECGGTDVVHNLILGDTKAAIEYTIDTRRSGSWTAENIGVFGNVIAGTGMAISNASPDFMRSAGRRFDGNLYGAAPADARWSVERREPLDFAAWRRLWQEANGGRDWDGGSGCVAGCSYRIADDLRELVVRMPADAVLPRREADPRLPADFSGQTYSADALAPAGPFADLRPGENRFTLWAGPLPPFGAAKPGGPGGMGTPEQKVTP